MSAGDLLARIPLFAEIPARERAQLALLMRPFSLAPGEVLFREGAPGDGLYLIERGRVQAWAGGTGGARLVVAELGPGDLLGELSLVGAGERSATVAAVEATTGWSLDRSAFGVLRDDPRAPSSLPRIVGAVALERLHERHAAVAAAVAPAGAHEPRDPLRPASPPPDGLAYLRSIVLLSGMTDTQIGGLLMGLRRLEAPRGAVILAADEPPPALFLVVRGAIEVTIRGGRARRVGLAGPGRLVGHAGALAGATHPAECRARERTIVYELPWPRVADLLAGGGSAARAFAAAFYEDTVRALLQAQRPHPEMAPARRPHVAAQAA